MIHYDHSWLRLTNIDPFTDQCAIDRLEGINFPLNSFWFTCFESDYNLIKITINASMWVYIYIPGVFRVYTPGLPHRFSFHFWLIVAYWHVSNCVAEYDGHDPLHQYHCGEYNIHRICSHIMTHIRMQSIECWIECKCQIGECTRCSHPHIMRLVSHCFNVNSLCTSVQFDMSKSFFFSFLSLV